MMNSEAYHLNVVVAEVENELDAEQQAELTRSLMRRLREFDIESVTPVAGESAPEGAKGDPVTVGALALVIAPILLPHLCQFLQNWIGKDRKVILEASNGAKIEFTPDRRYTENDILQLMAKLDSLSSHSTHSSQPNEPPTE
jgi:hypothetical protein